MSTDEELWWTVTEAMIRFGGSFVRRLGELYRAGDPTNQARLRGTFPEYFAKYARREFVTLLTQERGPRDGTRDGDL